eukprot:CAMPEP_0183399580 /NCGR_PEP_ID=MMETSP0370-20130417/12026_1 /TAXON_ID=268820 /ORGANISM="Peridinium aciculiferum, Strain PAER-2" /LENGTH=359 /DNA_ID=CAMNT_0025580751 /DNA_START=52 /DNA_END=1131 /DNA_ORIENTATION=+
MASTVEVVDVRSPRMMQLSTRLAALPDIAPTSYTTLRSRSNSDSPASADNECSDVGRSLTMSTTADIPFAEMGNDFHDDAKLDEADGASVGSFATSSADWRKPEQVLFFLNWDDTLFPTTWFNSRLHFKSWARGASNAEEVLGALDAKDREHLDGLDQAARAFLVAAASLGEVCIVTSSQHGWAERTCEAFLPRLSATRTLLGIKVRHTCDVNIAKRRASVGGWTPLMPDEQEALEKSVAVKRIELTMVKALRAFYGREGAWRNVLSFGDGARERHALQNLGFRHGNRRSARTCEPEALRVKTVKLSNDPSCHELCEQLQVVQSSLVSMVAWRDDFDLDLGCSDDEFLNQRQRMQEGTM